MADTYQSPDPAVALGMLLRASAPPRPRRPAEPQGITSARPYFASNAEMARSMSGLGPGRLPARGSPERRRYEADLRAVQRYTTEAAQRRGGKRPAPELAARAVTAAQPGFRERVRQYQRELAAWPQAAARALQGAISRARRDGLRMRLLGFIIVSRREEFHTMPAGAGGRAAFVHIPGRSPQLRRALDQWAADNRDGGGQLLNAFFTHYWAGYSDEEPADVEAGSPCELTVIDLVEVRW